MKRELTWRDTFFMGIREAVEVTGCSWPEMEDYITRGLVHLSTSPIHRRQRRGRVVHTKDIVTLVDDREHQRYGVPIENLPARFGTPNIVLHTPAVRPPKMLPIPMLPVKAFFVYVLRLPNGNPFYVGKGTGSRPYEHINEAQRGECTCRKCRIIHLVLKMRKEVLITYEYQTDSKDDALRHESMLIRSLCRDYQLANRSGNPYYDRDLPRPSALSNLTYERMVAYLDRMPLLTRQDRDQRIAEWREDRIEHLEKRWRVVRMQHREDEETEINAELEDLRAASGAVLQWRMPLEGPGRTYALPISYSERKKRRRSS